MFSQDPYLLVPMPVPDCGRFWRIWRHGPVARIGDADDLGLYAADACLARGRFLTDMTARKFHIADVSGGPGAAGLSAMRTIWAYTPPTPVWRAEVLSPTWPKRFCSLGSITRFTSLHTAPNLASRLMSSGSHVGTARV
jgi:hypothetical protein